MAEEPKKGEESKSILFGIEISAEDKAYFRQLSGDIGKKFGDVSTKLSKSNNKFVSDLGNMSGDLSKAFTGFTGGLTAGLTNIGMMFLDKLSDLIIGAFDELNEILDFSRISQSGTRNLMLGYGFSSSESYGYSKAMSALGFESDEDLMYANPQEMEMFRNAFTKYTEKYSELYDKGFFDDMLEYQVEMNEFEEDLKLEVVEWLMENKDLIRTGMTALLEMSKGILSIVSFLFNGPDWKFDTSSAIAQSSAVINQYKNGGNITMSNTFNNVTKENQSWINESVGASVTLLKQLQN